MLAVIVANDTVVVLVRHDQSFLLELEPIAESDEAALGKAKECDVHQIMRKLKGKMLLLVDLTL